MKEILCELAGGESVYRDGANIVAVLPPGRAVLSTSWLNGGCRKDLRMVFNHQLSEDSCRSDDLEGGGVEAYLRFRDFFMVLEPVDISCSTSLFRYALNQHKEPLR